MTDSAGEFVPSPRSQDCSKHAGGWGRGMNDYEYIWYGNKSEDDYPEEACTPYYHKSAQIDKIQVNTEMSGAMVILHINICWRCTAGGHTLSSKCKEL